MSWQPAPRPITIATSTQGSAGPRITLLILANAALGGDRPCPPAREGTRPDSGDQALARVRAAFLAALLRLSAFRFLVRAAFLAAALRFCGP